MSSNLLGNICIAVSLGGAGLGAVAASRAGARQDARLLRWICGIGYIIFAAMTVASLAMVYALVTDDFSVGYVSKVGSTTTPRFFSAISLWSSLEGSILLWGWVLSAYTAACLYVYRPGGSAITRDLQPLIPWVACTLFCVGIFFYLVLAFPANPFFTVSPIPTEGPGPNPLLQNHWLMALHPPFLYLGYVGMTVPFAFGIASLIAGDITPRWIDAIRRWTLVAWASLSIAIVLGGWWSYAVLGWGGYWAWDPVENASFMPWLTGTAFIHSIMVQQRRGMLKVWNLVLIIVTFLLTLLGTFLTRSGVIESVHAFTQSTIGHYFLVAIVTALAASTALLLWKGERFRTQGRFDHPICRETAILAGNLLLVCFCFVVLLGTLYPMIVEALRGAKVSVGEPFFNQMTVPLAVALLLLMAIGVALPWQRPNGVSARRRFGPPLLIAAMGTIAAGIVGVNKPWVLATIGVTLFALAIMGIEWIVVAWTARAIVHPFRVNPRRYGGFIVHCGVICIAAGIACSKSYQQEQQISLLSGERASIGRYELTLEQLFANDLPQRFEVVADVGIAKAGRPVGVLQPRLNFYQQSRDPIGSPAVRSTLVEDLYLTLMAFDHQSGQATIRAIVTPAVAWIWLGGGCIIAGVSICLRRPRFRSNEETKDEGRRNISKGVSSFVQANVVSGRPSFLRFLRSGAPGDTT